MSGKLTKKECKKAYDTLFSNLFDLIPFSAQDKYEYIYTFCLKTFQHLIEEYFDNLPLKLEEIEPGEYIWDNSGKGYLKILIVSGRRMFVQSGIFLYIRTYWIDFEKDRFYRKEVKE